MSYLELKLIICKTEGPVESSTEFVFYGSIQWEIVLPRFVSKLY